MLCLGSEMRESASAILLHADFQVPYIGMRSFCAIMGSITVPIVYGIMRESGYPVAIAAFTASLILFGKLRT